MCDKANRSNRVIETLSRRDVLRGGILIAGGTILADHPALALLPDNRETAAFAAPINMRCELLTEPLGLQIPRPRLSWTCADTRIGAQQSAFQIEVSSTINGPANLWDSGKVSSSDLAVEYAGTVLAAHQQAFWRVRTWSNEGTASTWSSFVRWSAGPSTEQDWTGSRWIAHDDLLEDTQEKMPGDSAQPPEPTFFPAPFLRKEFNVNGPVSSALISACGLGYAELHLNGQKVGDTERDPAFTNYDHSVLYVSQDVTSLLQSGSNVLGAILGTGWYDVHDVATWHFNTAPWRQRPRLRLTLAIEYKDGARSFVVSDESWQTSTGPILRDGIYTGEVYDARKEIPGWSITGFDAKAWIPALVVETPHGRLRPLSCEPIRITDTITPVAITQPKLGVYIVDMGQNFSGHVQLRVKGPSGQAITMRYAEMLNADGTLNSRTIDHFMENTMPRQPFQQDTYICKGTGEDEVWEQRFSYAGFQYAEITGFPGTPTIDNFRGRFAHTDVKQAGEFKCSNEVVNKIQHATLWSYRSNAQSYPTDCPQREKNGWTGDAGLAVDCGLMNFQTAAFYGKWLEDFAEAQRPDGGVPELVPNGGWGNGERAPGDTDPPWDAAYPIVAWTVYQYTGDKRLLARHVEPIRRLVDLLMHHRLPDGVLPNLGRGDWSPWKTRTPLDFVSTAYLYLDLTLLTQMYRVLGRTTDEQFITSARTELFAAIQKKFYDANTYLYSNGSQTAQSLALQFGLVPDKERAFVFTQLEKSVEQQGHLDTGIFGAKFLLHALSENGRSDLAYHVVTQPDKPGWGFWMKSGATTLWEGWSYGASINHIMFGDVSAWFYKWLAGIQQETTSVAFEKIVFRPTPVGDLTEASATYLSPRGEIRSAWRLDGRRMNLSLTVPCGSTARLILPAGARFSEPPTRRGTNSRVAQSPEVMERSFPAGSFNVVIALG
jgi:alpha-L-rhamnosidase